MRRDLRKLIQRTARMANTDYRMVAEGRKPSKRELVEQEYLQSLSRLDRETYLRQRDAISGDDEDMLTAHLLEWQSRR